MVNLSPEEKNALLAGSLYVLVPLQQKSGEKEYKAGGKMFPKSMLESLRHKGLLKIDGNNYKHTDEGQNEVNKLSA